MKWWYWLILELLIIFGVTAWIFFFPGKIEEDLAKGLIGFVLFYAVEECRNINKRKQKKVIYFKHPGLGGRRVVIRGFKLDDGKERCELCNKAVSKEQLGTLTITYGDTGETETHKVCLECGKKLEGGV